MNPSLSFRSAGDDGLGLGSLRGLQDLAFICGCDVATLGELIENTERHYRHWFKRKKNGKLRKISAPDQKLKSALKNLSLYLVEKCKLPAFLHGGVKGKSPKTNAKNHLGHPHLLNLDLRDFYPSTSRTKIVAILRRYGALENIAQAISIIVSLNNGLPQGAPTSSILSNLAFENADTRLLDLCRKNGLIYTRFVDDISISGERDPKGLLGPILSIIKDSGFAIATEKTAFLSKDKPQVVTGIQVNSGLNLPRAWRSELRHLIKECHQLGPGVVARQKRMSLEKLRQHVYGKINHLKDVNQREGRRVRRLACNLDWRGGSPTPIGFPTV